MPEKSPPFFIVGMPRSGTKLLRELLNQSPDVWVPDVESQFIPRYARRMKKYGDLSHWPNFERMAKTVGGSNAFVYWARQGVAIEPREWFDRCATHDWPGAVTALFQLVYEQSSYRPDRDWSEVFWGDKSPQYVTEVSLLSRLFPQSSFIHIVRDPRDVSLSVATTWGQHPLRAAQRWTEAIDSCRAAGERLGPDRYAEVRYEDILARPGEETARLCAFLGVETPANAGTLARPAEGGTTDVVRDNSGKFQVRLSPGLQRSIEALTARGLDAYGYGRLYPEVAPATLNRFDRARYTLHDGWRTVKVRQDTLGGWRNVLRSLRA